MYQGWAGSVCRWLREEANTGEFKFTNSNYHIAVLTFSKLLCPPLDPEENSACKLGGDDDIGKEAMKHGTARKVWFFSFI